MIYGKTEPGLVIHQPHTLRCRELTVLQEISNGKGQPTLLLVAHDKRGLVHRNRDYIKSYWHKAEECERK